MKEHHSSHLRKTGACLHQLLNLRNENLLSTPERRCTWSPPMVKCKRMKRQRCMSNNWVYSWLWRSSKTCQQYCRSESFAMKKDILMNGSMVKNHISLKTGFEYSPIRRTSFLLWFPACQRVRLQDLHRLQRHLRDRRVILHHLLQPRLLHPTISEIHTRERGDQVESDISPVQVSNTVDDRSGRLDGNQANQTPKTNQKEPQRERWDPLSSEIPEWLQEFRENLVDDEIPLQGGSHASSSHEAS